ncbi:MAG: Rieske 2Fe-2S domain-containing protein [Actinomadura sp.]
MLLSRTAVRALRTGHRVLHRRPRGDGTELTRTNRGWHRAPLPQGWFLVLRSRDLARGGVRGVRLLDRDLVAFRTSDGTLGVLDAYCPHLGADLRTGDVRKDCLRCPFHGLLWAPDGTSPNGATRPSMPAGTTARSYPVIERNDSIHIWVDEIGRPPSWEPPQFAPDIKQLSRERVLVDCNVHVESMACFDFEHAEHSHSTISTFLRFKARPETTRRQVSGHRLEVEVEVEHTRLPLVLRLNAVFYGPAICSSTIGVQLGRTGAFTTLGARTYTGLIPIDAESHLVDNAVYVERDVSRRGRLASALLAFWVHTVMLHEDMLVWNHLKFHPGGPYYQAFWDWYHQFVYRS